MSQAYAIRLLSARQTLTWRSLMIEYGLWCLRKRQVIRRRFKARSGVSASFGDDGFVMMQQLVSAPDTRDPHQGALIELTRRIN